MSSDRGFRRQPVAIRAAIALLVVIALAGLALIGNGLYIKAKAELSQILLNRSFERRVAGLGDGRPWPWADFKVVARISAPRLHKSGVVIAGATGQALAFGPAWLEATPRPGEAGTSVIAAHRDTHFAWLGDVKPGDTIRVELAEGRALEFRAADSRVARWDDNGIDISAAGHHLALATCWPLDAKERGPLRYIVDAEMVQPRQAVLATRR